MRFGISPHTLRFGNQLYAGINLTSAGAMSGTPAFPTGTDSTTNTVTQVIVGVQVIAVDFFRAIPQYEYRSLREHFFINLEQSVNSTNTVTGTSNLGVHFASAFC